MRVEWLILADYAEIVGGKLYLMGGGWDVLTVNTGFPLTRPLGLAAAFSVPWNETNERQNVEIDIQTEDGQSVGKVRGEFEVGRPAGIKQGQDQRFQLAATVPLNLPAPGTYVIVAKVGGEEQARVPFNVVGGPMLQPKQA
ncbi:MAG: hypothetical protein ABSC13_03695 [Dehalococcoidia bacterium]